MSSRVSSLSYRKGEIVFRPSNVNNENSMGMGEKVLNHSINLLEDKKITKDVLSAKVSNTTYLESNKETSDVLTGEEHFFKTASTLTPQKAKTPSKRKKINLMTPQSKGKRKGNFSLSSIKKKGGKLLVRQLTPPRSIEFGCTDHMSGKKKTSHSTPLTMSSKFSNAEEYKLSSSEHEPSMFQLELPQYASMLSHSKICAVIDNYTEVAGLNFDFSTLMPWKVQKINSSSVSLATQNSDTSSAHNLQKKKILCSLEDAIDDIVVEGFFRHYFEDKKNESGLGRVEACVFSSHKHRQFIVCYRGSSKLMDKPIQGVQVKAKEESCSGLGRKPFEVDINAKFLAAYHQNLEENIFTLLSRLAAFKPFCDIVMLGHSFGGVLATQAATRYASLHPMMRVKCHLFGSPKIGGILFRNNAHSIPNLNVIRVERGSDPFVRVPEGNEWVHVGHTLTLHTTATSFPISDESRPVETKAYRFDKHRPSSNFVKSSVKSLSNLTKLKIGNEIKSYMKDLEKIGNLGLSWVHAFVGEEGSGVCATDNEVRLVV